MQPLAALYARVSTLQQEQEATIDSQVAAVETFAQAHGYHLLRDYYFLDCAVSGAQLARPALDRLRDLAPEGLFQVLLCYSPDRLARQYGYLWVLLHELQQVGIQVLFVNQPIMADDPQSQLFLGMQGLFGEYERAMITERLRRGKLYRVRQGQLQSPVAPYGYRYVPVREAGGGHWEVVPHEAAIVRRIYTWYLEQGWTMRQIVVRLQELGAETPPRGRRWQLSTVQDILKNEDYTGQAYYNRTCANYEGVGRPKRFGRGLKRTAQRVPRPPEEWISIQVPALIAHEVWQRVQEQLTVNRRFASRHNTQHHYLLRSLLVCDICGRILVGRTSGSRVTYYCSDRGADRNPDVPKHHRGIAAEVIEPLVWEAVSNLLRNPALLEQAWSAEEKTETGEETSALRDRLGALDRQWERLIDLYQEGQVTHEELTVRKRRLDQQREHVEQQMHQHRHQEQAEQRKQQQLQGFAAFCQRIEANLTNPTPELQREVIRLLIDHIVVGEHEIVIKHIVPTDDDCRLRPEHR